MSGVQTWMIEISTPVIVLFSSLRWQIKNKICKLAYVFLFTYLKILFIRFFNRHAFIDSFLVWETNRLFDFPYWSVPQQRIK